MCFTPIWVRRLLSSFTLILSNSLLSWEEGEGEGVGEGEGEGEAAEEGEGGGAFLLGGCGGGCDEEDDGDVAEGGVEEVGGDCCSFSSSVWRTCVE